MSSCVVEFVGGHFSVGQQIGFHTRGAIVSRLEQSEAVRQTVEWVQTTAEGTSAYDAMLASAELTFPQYVLELQGMAVGSGVSFQTLFVLNTRNELASFQNNAMDWPGMEHCSDYLLANLHKGKGEREIEGEDEIVIAHNEDGGSESRSISTLVTVHLEGDDVASPIRFTSFVYPGDLPTDAFFWNAHGVVGSMNGLYPTVSLFGGLGRNFISRDLCESTSLDDAIKRATRGNQATGHSFNLASRHERCLVNVEVAPGIDSEDRSSLYVVTDITTLSNNDNKANNSSGAVDYGGSTSASLFRANSYLFLEGIDTNESPSSAHRLARAAELPPATDSASLRRVLGDHADTEYPIYRTATGSDTGYTLTTVLFTLKYVDVKKPAEGTVVLYLSNPWTNERVRTSFASLEIQ